MWVSVRFLGLKMNLKGEPQTYHLGVFYSQPTDYPDFTGYTNPSSWLVRLLWRVRGNRLVTLQACLALRLS